MPMPANCYFCNLEGFKSAKTIIQFHSTFSFAKCLCICSLVFGLFSFAAQGQEFPPVVAKAYRLAQKLKVDSARTLLAQPMKGDAEACRLLALSYADFIEVLVGEADDEPAWLGPKVKTRFEALDDLNSTTAWARHARAEMILHEGLLNARFGNNVKAVITLRKAFLAGKENGKDFPTFLPAQKSLGIYNLLFGLAPSQYRWALRLFSVEGSADEGIADLKRSSSKLHAQQQESYFLLGLANIFLKDNPQEGTRLITQYIKNEPDDIAGLAALATVYMRGFQNQKGLSTALFAKQDASQVPFHYLKMLRGELYLQQLQYDSAISNLESYLAVCSQTRFVKDLHYKLFLAYYLKGNKEKANTYFYTIPSVGTIGSEGDRYAEYFSKRGLIPNKALLRSRLLFDGGYWAQADAMLDSIRFKDLPSTTEQTELAYRRARIAQKTGNIAKAKALFQLAISIGAEDPSYFAAMSSLQLGYLYRKEGKPDDAKSAFERVLTFPEHEYKDGLDYRANSGMKSLKRKPKS
jgi:tetratricopeptide (TPR) repeat protein